jgi:type 1 fimbria pilin
MINTQAEKQGNTMRANLNDMGAMRCRHVVLSFFFLSLLLVLGARSANAACVKKAGFQEKFVEMSMGRVLIPNELKVGDTIVKREFAIPIRGAFEVVFECGPGGGSATGFQLQSPQLFGNNIYYTNVPGVGIRLARQISTRNSPGASVYYPQTLNFEQNSDPTFYSPSNFQVELIKIAPQTGNGPLSSGIYTQYIGNGGGGSVLTTQLTEQGITLVTPSCTVATSSKNIMVNFGKVPTKEFRGKGSTTAERKFNIQLDCKPGQNIQNTISIRIDAVPDPFGNKGVLEIKPEKVAATGIGIQLINPNSQPVQFGEDEIVGPSMDGSYVLSYVARYFQVSEKVLPGKADGMATFSVIYK